MNKNSIIDYSGYILLKLCGPLVRALPKPWALFLGRVLADLLYVLDLKHRALAYANIKTAVGDKLSPSQIRKLTRKFYRSFGQNFIEIFLIPLIDKRYIDKYVSIEGLEHLASAFKRQKGVIFVAVHAGSWELSNILSANLGFKFSMFVRQQKWPRLERLLNSYRSVRGCRFIQKENQTRQLIQVLKDNESTAMTVDQGGRDGVLVKFFGKDASMASGAIRLALKYDCCLIPIFPTRLKGPYLKFSFQPAFELKKTGDEEKDIRNNLQELIKIFQGYIEKYPQEYLWSYKIWKYSREKSILILSDGKTGHLRQSQSLAKLVEQYLKQRGIKADIQTKELKFANRISRYGLTLSNCLAGKYICQGCLLCLRRFLAKDDYEYLRTRKFDIIISCGSSLVPVNYILARENLAKSMVIMRPSIFSVHRFDLVIEPKHDSPPAAKNIAVIDAALNLIDEQYLKEQSEQLKSQAGLKTDPEKLYLGLLIGGDTKKSRLTKETIKITLDQIKKAADNLGAQILATTSRRTSPEVEDLVKRELLDHPACKLLVIANEKNYSSCVGAILGLCRIVLTSGESISMISEAVSSKKYVVVFGFGGLGGRHKRFLDNLSSKRHIFLAKPGDLGKTIEMIWKTSPQIKTLRDNEVVMEALKKVL